MTGATTGLDGAMTGPCEGLEAGGAAGAGFAVVAGGLGVCPCASTRADASPNVRLAIVPATAKERIYFFGAGGAGFLAAAAGGTAGGGGTGSENITRPLTSS